MDFADRLKDIRSKVEDAAVEHEDRIRDAVDRAEATANQKSGGKYSEQLRSAGVKADELVDKLTANKKQAAAEPPKRLDEV